MHATRHGADETASRRTMRGMIVIAALVLLGACASPAKFERASAAPSFPSFEGDVTVLQNLPPAGDYDLLGIVRVEGVLLTKEEEMMARLKSRAADEGANAVVLQAPMKVITNSDGSTTRKLAAWAIRLPR